MKLSIFGDNSDAAEILQEIADLCDRNNAQWNPKLEVEIKEGEMRLLAPVGCEGKLITMPTDLLIPIKRGAQWEIIRNEITIIRLPAGLSGTQKQLLQLQLSLYNCTRKINIFNQNQPSQLMRNSLIISKAVNRLKPKSANFLKKNPLCDQFFVNSHF